MHAQRVREIDLDEDMPLERATWTIERAGWLLMLLALAAAFVGLCGSRGPFSQSSAGDLGSGLAVEYDRFPRHGGRAQIEVRVDPSLAKDGMIRLWVERRHVENFTVESISPEPEAVEAGPDRIIYSFLVEGATRPVAVSATLKPETYWLHRARLGVVGGPTVRLRQFVYP